jgi:hypothetical protein
MRIPLLLNVASLDKYSIGARRESQNLRRGHYELGVDALPGLTLTAAFDELALVV